MPLYICSKKKIQKLVGLGLFSGTLKSAFWGLYLWLFDDVRNAALEKKRQHTRRQEKREGHQPASHQSNCCLFSVVVQFQLTE